MKNTHNTHRFRRQMVIGLAVAIIALAGNFSPANLATAQQTRPGSITLLAGINFTSLPFTYAQSFDNPPTTLPVSGTATWADDSTVSGWSAKRSGTGTGIAADTGTGTGGNLYSYGAASNADRALGSIGSGNAAAGSFTWGVCFKNDSGATVTLLDINYDGEQWRKSGVTTAQTVDFDYQIGADCVEVNAATGWTAHNALDFSSPVNTATGAALDGNTTGKVSLSSSIPVSLASGQAVTLRWSDIDHSGSDHGMAIDNFSLTASTTGGGDDAPSVSSTTPTSGASGVLISADLLVNFSEAVDASGSWFDISCATSGSHNAVVTGGPQNFTLNPDADFSYGETCTATIFAAQVTDQDSDDPPDNMAADYSWNFSAENLVSVSFIHDIQGSADTSPLSGSVVSIDGIVVGDFQDTVSGFFVQEEDAQADADPLTSEGIFVYSTTPVASGDRVRVTGTATEYFGETEISPATAVTIVSSGNPLPALTNVLLPVAANADWERFEGMRVNFPQTLIVSETYLLGRGGLLTLSGSRIFQPTHLAAPGAPALALAAANALNIIFLDDGSQAQNPDPIRYPTPGGLSAANTVRGGDQVSGVQGVVTYRYHGWSGSLSAYRIYPTFDPTFSAANPRPAAPAANGSLRIASFNVLNYFNGPTFPTARGATTAAEFTRQRDKIINAIFQLDADIIGLMELENDGYAAGSAIQDLVNGLNAVAGSGTYAFINPGVATFGGDEITVGLIYRPASVTPVGAAATTTAGAFTQDAASRRNRQPMAQTFQEIASGEKLTVVVNHFKSKGSDCATAAGPFPADPDTGDGQGNCNITRTMAAEDLLTWMASDPTGSGDPDFLIVGDLNAYAQEDPITTLTAGGFSDLINTFNGTNGYSYVFDGQAGYLDHAEANASLAAQVTHTGGWHINADEPISLDYNVEFKTAGQQTSLYAPDAYRSSDHDPAVIDLYLPYGLSDMSDLPASYGAAWHRSPHSLYLGSSVTNDSSVAAGNDNLSDDGVVRLSSPWQPGGSATVRVTATGGAGWFSGWFDWNVDGVFDLSERAINQAVNNGPNDITFTIPANAQIGLGAPAQIAARFRLYESLTEPADAPDAAQSSGGVNGGEVEDYQWSFGPTAVTLQSLNAQPAVIWPWLASVLGLVLVGMLVVSLRRLRRARR